MYKNILAIDTSKQYCLITLQKKKHICNIVYYCPYSHTKYLLFLIKKILKRQNIFLSDIHLLGYNLGPGNFSSMRIGIALIETISYVFNIPKIGISHLMILAEKSWKKTGIKNIITTIKCDKNHIYFALYKKNIKGLWIGKNTECILNNNNFLNKISVLRGEWVLLSDTNQDLKQNIKKLLNKDLKIFFLQKISNSSEEIIHIINNMIINKKKINKNYKINYMKNTI
ncbi:tRNA (adenosine(37)-N6)-threonylcarbamoyltransferase complex dimerization subunit type 1 TsaB [Enterobacteriaceae endosymbiont of Donacia tomentosa]|uniref:tRNA (adenosine(37)-N6)-threonylcarbamoyltransferase complex dimerization subunit type 1 TsaB n=1 Tax=Enterobacteriaceae endosymbiont of Donacia tomentosa TaxID=2675787 RepID=UPI001449DA64|nr:tRNA (adenosine(37)-N6)-threonylcarbamoyltransferase complex dimerization subunit type 1 TsaB [Enterobacteriaceae endosymbiont of Donacia tomentosa]QJC31566.1 tRNA (adenosine(37)-N6)-threonylcarbamoyltransferase complex dimerization subunit type 1 TsaB [Enterobacteriaceae endosymbiont of Donacia tomentosa]